MTIDKIIVEQFHGHAIAFHPGDAFVNLTTMCRAFGKSPHHFLQLESSKAFTKALETETSGNPASLTVEGRNGGTWAHPDLALECARWLSPEFAIWTNRVIRALLSGGMILSKPEEREIDEVLSELKALLIKVTKGQVPNGVACVAANIACQYLRGWDVKLRLRAPSAVLALPAS